MEVYIHDVTGPQFCLWRRVREDEGLLRLPLSVMIIVMGSCGRVCGQCTGFHALAGIVYSLLSAFSSKLFIREYRKFKEFSGSCADFKRRIQDEAI